MSPILVMLPAILKLLTHFRVFLTHRDLKTTLVSIARAVGITNRKIKYRRSSSKQFGIRRLYYLLIYGQFLLVTYLLADQFAVLFLAGLILFLLNSTYVRFADIQTIYMLMFSLATIVMMENPEPWLLLSYWIVASPLPFLLAGFSSSKQALDVVPKFRPFAISPLIESMEKCFAPVREGERIFMAFDNPNGVYEELFDGYRNLLELPVYVATMRKIHFMPDWWGVFELNYEGAPEIWGRDVESVKGNVRQWRADYAVIYQTGDREIEQKWLDAGFQVFGKVCWAELDPYINGTRPYRGEPPNWWLLKSPNQFNVVAKGSVCND